MNETTCLGIESEESLCRVYALTRRIVNGLSVTGGFI
jgi:hypothetical protein